MTVGTLSLFLLHLLLINPLLLVRQVVVGEDKSREFPSISAPFSFLRGFARSRPVRPKVAQPPERTRERAVLLQENQACHSQQEIQCV